MTVDVSEREVMESRIRDAQKLESLGVMASGIAHDFNNSLMIMLGNTALLRSMEGLPSRAVEHIELIEESGARADRLIKHLLAYARTGRHNPQPTDLNDVIRDARTFVQSSVGKQYQLDIRLAKPLPTVLADRGQIEQILLNLCLNASQAMASGGVIRILTGEVNLTATDTARCVPYDAKPGRYVELAVTDGGHGMDETTVIRVFDPFFTTKREGHGLGLAAVLGILRQHRAVAAIDSTVGKGSTVHIFFPVQQNELKTGERSPHRKRRTRSTGAGRRKNRRGSS